jgi:glycosyltransferase involved in cell wall biosynthesis
MIKILFASHSAALTGAPNSVYNIVTNIDRSRFEPLVLFPETGPMVDKLKAANVPITVIDIGDSLWGTLHIPMIEALCKSSSIDLVHANTVHGFPFALAADKCNIPCFWQIREMLVSGSNLSYILSDAEAFNSAFERATLIGLVSHASERELQEYCRSLGIVAPPTAVVHNGVAMPPTYRSYQPKDPVQLLSIGTLARHKGHEFLIDALAQVNSGAHKATLTILGDADPWHVMRLWEQAERVGVAAQVHIQTAESDISNRIDDCDIVVIPSLVENFNLSIAQAMAHAKPVVATDVGGTGELVVTGETGLLVPPKDSDALALAILRFIENAQFARQCGEKARERVAKNFATEGQVAKLQEIYLSLAASFKSQRASLSKRPEDDYNLLTEALVAINEKFRRVDLQIARANAEVANTRENLTNVVNDIRTLEAVVKNLLQKLPFRVLRKVKDILRAGTGT